MRVSRPRLASVFLLFLLAPRQLAPNGARAELTASDLAGKRVRLRDYRGQPVVLNFWATWCGPCNVEMPLLVDAQKDYGARGVAFIAVSLDDSKSKQKVPEFVSKYHVDFPVWLGATADDLARLEMGEAVPATAFIDSQGHIAARVLGQIRGPELRERVDWLLGAGAAPAPLISHVDSK
jgi:thiol-disulfide isomerase/thioredoxin